MSSKINLGSRAPNELDHTRRAAWTHFNVFANVFILCCVTPEMFCAGE